MSFAEHLCLVLDVYTVLDVVCFMFSVGVGVISRYVTCRSAGFIFGTG